MAFARWEFELNQRFLFLCVWQSVCLSPSLRASCGLLGALATIRPFLFILNFNESVQYYFATFLISDVSAGRISEKCKP